MKIEFLENEFWYGGIVHIGWRFPISRDDDINIELVGGHGACDQYSPLFLSSKGRIIHGKMAFNAHFNKGVIEIADEFEIELFDGFSTLKGAMNEAAHRYFELSGSVPNRRFFRTPQYNTWIELTYNQNEKDILNYAKTLVDGGMAPGVLMIDEGWAPDYGIYDFAPEKFSDPKGMIDTLHEMGFSVMLWVTPMISPDSNCFRDLRDTDILLHDKDGEIAVRKWWNGYSCVLDFSNPKTREWFGNKLKGLMDKYGVDGFKFDCGDTYLYKNGDRAYISAEPNAHTEFFNRYCGGYEFNELRNVWNCGGTALVCRLQDKLPKWDTDGIKALIPNMLAQGVLGYYFGCPDMIGGGAYGAFINNGYDTDEELYLRWLAASLLCPMMQFSISPKRILSDASFKAVTELVAIREKYTDKIIELAERAAVTGEPILRYMEYAFPGNGYEKITDQFMLGEDILVAPIFEKGTAERTVALPKGRWKNFDGRVLDGGRNVTLEAKLNELIILEKQ